MGTSEQVIGLFVSKRLDVGRSGDHASHGTNNRVIPRRYYKAPVRGFSIDIVECKWRCCQRKWQKQQPRCETVERRPKTCRSWASLMICRSQSTREKSSQISLLSLQSLIRQVRMRMRRILAEILGLYSRAGTRVGREKITPASIIKVRVTYNSLIKDRLLQIEAAVMNLTVS